MLTPTPQQTLKAKRGARAQELQDSRPMPLHQQGARLFPLRGCKSKVVDGFIAVLNRLSAKYRTTTCATWPTSVSARPFQNCLKISVAFHTEAVFNAAGLPPTPIRKGRLSSPFRAHRGNWRRRPGHCPTILRPWDRRRRNATRAGSWCSQRIRLDRLIGARCLTRIHCGQYRANRDHATALRHSELSLAPMTRFVN